MATTRMSLKLFMDKEKKTVKFAECGNDFVDVLLSFLTMPIGTIIRLTDKESKIGGMSTLYESVGRLDVSLLQTEACRKMLLHPKNASEEHCKNLKVNIDDTEPTKYYKCSCDCCAKNCGLVSTVYNAQCGCGQSMKTQKEKQGSSTSVLEEKEVDVGKEEVLQLLERSLLSKTPLTDVLLPPHRNDFAGPQAVPSSKAPQPLFIRR
ncbi:hypothetical protein AAC387_Pa12g1015 [Persea americana]